MKKHIRNHKSALTEAKHKPATTEAKHKPAMIAAALTLAATAVLSTQHSAISAANEPDLAAGNTANEAEIAPVLRANVASRSHERMALTPEYAIAPLADSAISAPVELNVAPVLANTSGNATAIIIADELAAVHVESEPVLAEAAPIIPRHNRELGQQMAAERGWTGAEWIALEKLWTRESDWRHEARNPSSGAFGIPQSLPAHKMATAGPDWRTNPATQITWGLDYIAERYGSPLNAWAHSERVNWY